MATTITATLISSENGFDDFNVAGLPDVHRACVGHGIKKGGIFNVYCANSTKLGATWMGSIESSLVRFAETHPGYKELRHAKPPAVQMRRHKTGALTS